MSSVTNTELPLWRRLTALGTGLGIAIGAADLTVAIVRARPSGPRLIAEATIADFRARPAAEWGGELSRFLNQAGESRLAATVLLPRHEVIVRTLNLPGVADKDAVSAIELQLDTLHPYGDEEIAWGWSRAAAGTVMVGIARRTKLNEYETVFGEAGLPLAALAFSPALIHAAIRIWSSAPAAVLCMFNLTPNRTEVYGESEARPVYSAEFAFPPERALSVTRAELRLPPEAEATSLDELLPRAPGLPARLTAAYLAALAGSAPRTARFANLLPSARRASHDRVQYLLPIALAAVFAVVLVVAFGVLPAIEARRYRADLNAASRRLEPAALRARSLERNADAAKTKVALLDDFRRRPQSDLDSLNELTRLLAPPVWTNSIEIYPDSIVIAGESDNAAPLLRLLDSSPLFQNSEFVSSVVRTQGGEQFRIKTMRRGRTGRNTP